MAARPNNETLDELQEIGHSRVVPVVLQGEVAKDTEALRSAAWDGAHRAFDQVGSAKGPNSTLAASGALYRWGRIVLMGRSLAPIPINIHTDDV